MTSEDRKTVLIVDDSLYNRGRSKSVELLARVFDHVENKYVKGLRMLTLGWSDGNTFIPVSFSLLSSENEKNRLCPMNERIDKRSNGYKGRKEAIQKSPASIVFARYIMLAMAERENKDDKTVGGIFFDCCDELKEIDFAKSISLLINLLKNILKKVKEISNEIVDSVVTNFINSIYISMVSRAFLPAKVEFLI